MIVHSPELSNQYIKHLILTIRVSNLRYRQPHAAHAKLFRDPRKTRKWGTNIFYRCRNATLDRSSPDVVASSDGKDFVGGTTVRADFTPRWKFRSDTAQLVTGFIGWRRILCRAHSHLPLYNEPIDIIFTCVNNIGILRTLPSWETRMFSVWLSLPAYQSHWPRKFHQNIGVANEKLFYILDWEAEDGIMCIWVMVSIFTPHG